MSSRSCALSLSTAVGLDCCFVSIEQVVYYFVIFFVKLPRILYLFFCERKSSTVGRSNFPECRFIEVGAANGLCMKNLKSFA